MTRQEAITTVHKKVHDGKMYSSGHLFEAVANDGNADILIQIPAGKFLHAVFNGSVGGDCYAYLYEGATFSDVGTALSVDNHNRNSDKTSSATITHTPTISDTGARFNGVDYIPGGGGKKAVGTTSGGFDNEIILRGGEDYLMRITNKSGAETKASMGVEFYEVP